MGWLLMRKKSPGSIVSAQGIDSEIASVIGDGSPVIKQITEIYQAYMGT
jgi:hypothetical protein